MRKTIMVGGSAGMIGANFCKWLLKNTDYKIVGIDNLSGGCIENMPMDDLRFTFVKHDLSDGDGYLDNIFNIYQPFVFYAFNAYASEGRSNYIRSFIHANNTISMANIINACVNHKCKLIFTSSVAVYSGEPPFSEEQMPNPIDEYGLSKLTTEKSIQIAGKEQDLDWVIIRPRNVYGELQNIFDPSRNLFGIFCYNALNDLPLTIFGEGYNKRSFTYIDDILEPMYKAINFNHQVFNLGSENVYTINQAAEMFSEVSGYHHTVWTDERHEVKEAYCSIFKSKQMLGYQDKTSLYAGLKKMWEWAKKQPMKARQTPPNLEVFKTNHSSIV